jgi:hypothetical protein
MVVSLSGAIHQYKKRILKIYHKTINREELVKWKMRQKKKRIKKIVNSITRRRRKKKKNQEKLT